MTSSPRTGSRQVALEEAWQGRVNEARRAFEKQPTAETEAKLQRALHILDDLFVSGKLPPADQK
jgi:hypothetical protein